MFFWHHHSYCCWGGDEIMRLLCIWKRTRQVKKSCRHFAGLTEDGLRRIEIYSLNDNRADLHNAAPSRLCCVSDQNRACSIANCMASFDEWMSINIDLHLLPTIVEVIIRAAAVDLIFAPRQLTEWQRSCSFFVIVNFALKALYFSRQYWKSSCGYDNVRCGTDDKLYTFQVLSGILWLKLRMVMFACLSDYIIK